MRPQYTFKAPPAPKKAAKYTRIESCLFDVCVTILAWLQDTVIEHCINEDVQTYPLPSCSPFYYDEKYINSGKIYSSWLRGKLINSPEISFIYNLN